MLHLDYICVPATLICEIKEFDNFFSKMNSAGANTKWLNSIVQNQWQNDLFTSLN